MPLYALCLTIKMLHATRLRRQLSGQSGASGTRSHLLHDKAVAGINTCLCPFAKPFICTYIQVYVC